MPYYRVMLHGTGIRVPRAEPGQDLIGFYTTRVVHAPTEDDAADKVFKMVDAQWARGKYADSNHGPRPILSMEWVRRTVFLDLFRYRATGFIFYWKEDPED